MGLKKMIRDRIPAQWLPVLAKEKKIGAYVDQVYKSQCGFNHNKKYLPGKIKRIKDVMKESDPEGWSSDFWYTADFLNNCSNAEREEWSRINREIQNYKTSCK